MRRLGQSLAIAGVVLLVSPEWVPLEVSPWAIRGAAAALFLSGLTVAVLGAILAGLPREAVLDALPDEAIPEPCRPLVLRCEALGFERLGPALRVRLEPAVSVVPFWHAAERTYATVFLSDGAPTRAHYDFVTVFEPGDVGLTSVATPAAGVLPPPRGSFLQMFPNAAPEELLERHREGRKHLEQAGNLRTRPRCAGFEELLAQALRRQRGSFLRAPLRHTWLALWRVLTKRMPALGPVAAQAATRDRLDALADPRAEAERDAFAGA
jgi:hypothetical protein